MLIRCPDCGFERVIDPEAIASSAVRATCPRCKTKFYFRNPDGSFVDFDAQPGTDEAAASVRPAETAPPRAAAPRATAPRAAAPVDGDDDPLPPGAVVPDLPGLPGLIPVPDDDTPEDTPETPAHDTASPAPAAAPQGAPEKRPAAQRQLKPRPAAPEKTGLRSIFEKSLREARERLGKGRIDPSGASDQQAEDVGAAPTRATGSKGLDSFLPADDDVPWELPSKYGLIRGLYQTLLRVLFGAPRFFASLRLSSTPWIRPVTFYVILGMFQTVMERTWYLMSFQAMGPSIADPKVQELLGAMAHEMSLPMTLILAPATLFMQLAFYSSLFYLMVRLVQPESASFQLILRVIAYSAAPAVVCVVPLVGSLANAIWFAVCCCVGCKYALNMPWSRVLLALGPLYLVAFAVLGQFMRQLM